MYNKIMYCSICGCSLDPSYSSYSARPPLFKPVCTDCDRDMHAEQQAEDYQLNRSRVMLNGDHEGSE